MNLYVNEQKNILGTLLLTKKSSLFNTPSLQALS